MHKDIIIIGGGLCGLTSAYLLNKKGFKPIIFEARDRLGGRIFTLRNDGETPIEMGATWLGKKHQHLLELLDELNIDITEQYMGDKGYYEPMSISPPQLVNLPPNEEPSYCIQGGSDNLIYSLSHYLDENQILLNQSVTSIRKHDNKVEVETQNDVFTSDVIISTLPPKLLIDSISLHPSLSDNLHQTAQQTHTWMAESIKVALTFQEPFWRKPNSSGTIFSNVGPVSEMYDHSKEQDSNYALMGFMNEAYHSVSQKERKELVLNQLHRFYGDKTESYRSYQEMVWKDDPYSFSKYDHNIIPHQNNGNPLLQKPHWNNRLFISGSETATSFPGYMDGAIESAQRTVHQILEKA